jgi:hypothetical protein
MPQTEEEQARVMQARGDWFQELGDAVVDGGNPVAGWKTISSDGTVGDGGGADPVTGYSIIEADSLDGAVEKSKGCPQLASGGKVEVCETFRVM